MDTLYTFTEQQLVDIRRMCGYPVKGLYSNSGSAWVAADYFEDFSTMEFRLVNLTMEEGTTLVSVFLTNCLSLESAIPAAAANLTADVAGPYQHNKREIYERVLLFNHWRGRLCAFLGVPKGPEFGGVGSGSIVFRH